METTKTINKKKQISDRDGGIKGENKSIDLFKDSENDIKPGFTLIHSENDITFKSYLSKSTNFSKINFDEIEDSIDISFLEEKGDEMNFTDENGVSLDLEDILISKFVRRLHEGGVCLKRIISNNTMCGVGTK